MTIKRIGFAIRNEGVPEKTSDTGTKTELGWVLKTGSNYQFSYKTKSGDIKRFNLN